MSAAMGLRTISESAGSWILPLAMRVGPASRGAQVRASGALGITGNGIDCAIHPGVPTPETSQREARS